MSKSNQSRCLKYLQIDGRVPVDLAFRLLDGCPIYRYGMTTWCLHVVALGKFKSFADWMIDGPGATTVMIATVTGCIT
jgi:hypothetical protein